MKLLMTTFFMLMISMVMIGQQNAAQKPSVADKNGVKFSLDKEFIDLGVVKKGEKRKFNYTMTNTGREDIKISFVSYCDCSEVTYPENEVLKPGKSMVFDVIFDSSEKNEEETISIDVELENIDPRTGFPFYFTLDYHFLITK